MTGHRTPDRGERRLIALFDGEYDRIRRFVTVRAGSESVAADVTADTFADAARALAADPDADVDAGWLFLVARRRLADHWRDAERQRRKINRLISVGIDRDRPDSRLRDDHHDADRVRRALDSLPDRQRAALTLRYLDECSVADVAEHLATTYRAAESMLARARRGFIIAWRNQ